MSMDVKKTTSWLILVIYILGMLTLVSYKRKGIECTDIVVNIKDRSEFLFVEEVDVVSIINDNSDRILGQPIELVNIDILEKLLITHPFIKKADVYRTADGKISVNISQRNPIMRIITNSGDSYYIDNDGHLMPLSSKYTAHVLLANGNIKDKYTENKDVDLSGDVGENTMLFNLFKLGSYINNNIFWQNQIEQIYVKGNQVELIPRVGTQVIKFGEITDIEDKFKKLEALYQKALPANGWNKYKTINLKYKNQVICTKK